MRILADGTPGIVYTQDQLLGGESGQTFVGSRFPADDDYAGLIVREGEKVRASLLRAGMVGRFGIDFVVARSDGGAWQPYAIEINLREGGTSHPFGALYLLTGGDYDAATSTFRTPDGAERFYTASDDLSDPRLAGMPIGELLARAREAGLQYAPETQVGCVFHMLRSLPVEGKCGVTAIGSSRAHADDLYARAPGAARARGGGAGTTDPGRERVVTTVRGSDDTAVSAEAASRWHELLRSARFDDPGLERLREFQIAGRRPFAVARPHLMTPARYEQERLACALVGSALAKLSAAIWQDESLLDEFGLSDAERDLVTIDPGFRELEVTDRFDGFVSKRLGFVEVQGGAPGGLGLMDAGAKAFMQTSVFEQLAADYELQPPNVEDALREALLATWREWGGSGDPTIGIVDWDDAPLMMEFEQIQASLQTAGLQALIADPRTLRFHSGRLLHGSEPIDLVYRRLTIFDAIDRPDDAKPLVDAARAGAVCVVNPFANDLMGHKSVFSMLTDSARDLGLTGAERNAIHNHIPWTRRLEAGAADGDDAVSPEFVVEHRKSLAIKPTHDYEGHGVYLGWDSEPEEWEQLVATAAGRDYIVQRRVWAHREDFPRDEPGFPLQRFYVDTDPYVFRRRMGGILVRLSTEGVTNVSAGGSLVPSFLVFPR